MSARIAQIKHNVNNKKQYLKNITVNYQSIKALYKNIIIINKSQIK
jgi:sporulation protein YlmC with PRC-barrel domain